MYKVWCWLFGHKFIFLGDNEKDYRAVCEKCGHVEMVKAG